MLSKNVVNSRKNFRTEFSPQTTQVVGLVAKGWPSRRIADKLKLKITTVGTIKGNLTRGTYFPYATVNSKTGEVIGNCQF